MTATNDDLERMRAELVALEAAVERVREAHASCLFCLIGLSCQIAEALRAAESREAAPTDSLHASIECVLLDHAGEIGGDNADANLSELAYVYRQRTGWTVEQETAPDAPMEGTDGLRPALGFENAS